MDYYAPMTELKMKLARKFSRFERQKLGIAVLAGCFLASMTFVALPKLHEVPSPTVNLAVNLHEADDTRNSQQSVNMALSLHESEDARNSQQSEDIRLENATQEIKPKCEAGDRGSGLCGDDDVVRMNENSSTSTSLDSSGREDAKPTVQLAGSTNEKQEISEVCDDPKSDQCRTVGDASHPNESSSTITDPTRKANTTASDELDSKGEKEHPRKPLCDISDPRTDLCEMDGDIRIHGNSSTIMFVAHSQTGNSEGNNSWQIRPYARKGDTIAFSHVREVFVRLQEDSPQCTHNHSIPAIVFSIGGYTGNLFHDYTDVLVPLFLTANQFDGEVQFLVSDMNIWWIRKYELVLQKLSRYPIIDFDKDEGVHCFPRAIVGLRCHKELSIDPSRAPNGYSMVDFTRFMRRSYSLERDSPIRIEEHVDTKPRLLIISRKRTRAFLNVDEIVKMAEELGYEVVVEEADVASDVARYAQVVNSCDVMMGVHGAGLTNSVFLPTNATLIQIVPWGGLEWIAMLDFGEAAKDMKLNYLQYSISEDESSLMEQYPKDHPVFKNPFTYHNKGWDLIRNMFMDKQNVRLDVRRFRAVLLKALQHLH